MRKLLNLCGKRMLLLTIWFLLWPVTGNAQSVSSQLPGPPLTRNQTVYPQQVQSPARHGSGDRAGASTYTAVSTTIPPPLMTCESLGMSDKKHWWRVHNCKIADGHSIDEVLNNLMEQQDQYAHCGDFGPWILDQEGNIMGRYRNPPCPKGNHANQ